MTQIYFDRDQCKEFNISYRDGSSASLRADTILASKFQGYDKFHHETLGPFGSRFIRISRQSNDARGWYTINE
jgi:hypothetical protein